MDGEDPFPMMEEFIQPSKFNDPQVDRYDTEYISDIGNRMQVPDKISLGHFNGNNDIPETNGFHTQSSHMMVPDRIIVAGGNKHIGMKEGLRQLDFERVPEAQSMSYVGLITPPHTLTLQESFPTVEDDEKHPGGHAEGAHKLEANGMAPVPYTPGISPYDSLLLNEEDEATLLRTQVAKLTRRLAVMEQDNQRRSNREVFLYPAVFGYLFLRVFFWFFKNR